VHEARLFCDESSCRAALDERDLNAARKNRWGHRDATMILVAYRHRFRSAELVPESKEPTAKRSHFRLCPLHNPTSNWGRASCLFSRCIHRNKETDARCN
jgi:hypothetical protein